MKLLNVNSENVLEIDNCVVLLTYFSYLSSSSTVGHKATSNSAITVFRHVILVVLVSFFRVASILGQL